MVQLARVDTVQANALDCQAFVKLLFIGLVRRHQHLIHDGSHFRFGHTARIRTSTGQSVV